jgi:hypothetical protein
MGALVILPLQGVEVLDLEYRAEGLLRLTWASAVDDNIIGPYGLLWRYVALAPGPGRVTLDMRITEGWTPTVRPVLLVYGTGRLVFTGLKVRPPSSTSQEALAGLDRARRFAPEPLGHVTINSLPRPMWRVSADETLWDRLGLTFLALALLSVAAAAALRRGPRPAAVLAAVVLLFVIASDAYMVVKLGPPLRLGLSLDPEERLRTGFPFAPEVGALAAVARATLRPTDRVAVYGRADDWFGPQTLCFHLAPRRCVIVKPGAPARGISGVDALGDGEVDAVVAFNPDVPIPAGLAQVARVSSNAYVARRP